MRLIFLQPIFVEGPLVERPTPSVASTNLLTDCLKDLVPSDNSTAIDPQMMMEEFEKFEQQLRRKWMRNTSFDKLLALYQLCLRKLSSVFTRGIGTDSDDEDVESEPSSEQSIQQLLNDTIGTIVVKILKSAEAQGSENKFTCHYNKTAVCPGYEIGNGQEGLKGTITVPDLTFVHYKEKKNKDEPKTIIKNVAFKIEPPSINDLNNYSHYSDIGKNLRKIMKQAIGEAISISSFPIFLSDGQNFITLALPALPKPPVTEKIDAKTYETIFRFFNIKRLNSSSDKVISNTVIIPLITIMLALVKNTFNGIDIKQFVQKAALDPCKINSMYSRLLDLGKNNVQASALYPSPPSSASSSEEKEVNNIKNTIKKEAKRIISDVNLPTSQIIRRREGVITMILDTERVSSCIKFDDMEQNRKVVMKLCSINEIESFTEEFKREGILSSDQINFENLLLTIFEKFWQEIAINKYIDQHNKRSPKCAQINKPQLLEIGELITPNYHGLFYIAQLLPFVGNKPTKEEGLQNGLMQVKHLHDLNIAHSDIHLDNVCVNDNQLYLLDFGSSQFMGSDNRESLTQSDVCQMKELFLPVE